MVPIWLKPIMAWSQFERLKESLEGASGYTCINGLSEAQKTHMTASVLYPLKGCCLYVAYNEHQANRVYDDLNFFYPGKVILFPSREVILYNAAAHSHEITGQRLSVLEDLSLGRKKIIVASIESLLLPLMPFECFKKEYISLAVGEEYPPQDLVQRAVELGYERVLSVEGKGQFSLRGGIFDIFPLSSDKPWRVEFFDEDIDSIRSFDALSQRSIDKVNEIIISPARELLMEKEVLHKGRCAIESSLQHLLKKMESDPEFDHERLISKVGRILEGLDSGIVEDALFNYAPFFYNKPATLLDYIGERALVVLDEPSRIKENSSNLRNEYGEHFNDLLLMGEVLPEQAHLYINPSEIISEMTGFRGIILQSLPRGISLIQPKMIYQITSRTIPSYQGKLEMLSDDIRYWKSKNYSVLLLSGSNLRGQGLVNTMKEFGVEAVLHQVDSGEIYPGQVVVFPGTLSKGFEYSDARFVLVSDQEVYGVQKRKMPVKKKRKKLDPFTDLKVGDYVVHENHGIGKYLGIEKITVNGQKKDYLHVQYTGSDKLYIPTDQMDLIQPYIGMDNKAPRLSKLGGAEWQKAKNKVRHSVKELAEELLKLYAAREAAIGHSFSPDAEWQRQFEDLFPYEETPDQLQSVMEIKRDMESKRVMDRLLCGDVGYGKTEVAIRAAFKSVMEGKQVAVLAPTTILAQQHYHTFVNRFGDFPFTIQVISRFKSPKEQKLILKTLKEGNVDVVIGTHRLLGKDVIYKDLGLLVVDEEQRFGVAHKETIKNIKKNVDVLTLTATPIPRTLHMSLVGIRDISVIETPPEERYPVQTYVVEYNDSLIREAILREIQRGGQIYFVYNRVKTMEKMAERLRNLMPNVRVAVAHGQMSEGMLEKIMMSFYEREYDLLLCSTIIESGLDIPNVNTIIVYDADHFGLSQLYQLRGRVGRSNRLAYAYFTYRRDKILSEVAEKRLQAIKEFTEFGSGFKIAMRDLEIRGSGNLLGSQQHGHMTSVGYDLYCKLLHETVGAMKGEPVTKLPETTIDLKVDAFIDAAYIPRENEKIEIYKRIAAMESLKDRYDVEEEVEDRFGEIPNPVTNLIYIAYIKAIAAKLGFVEISQRGDEVRIKLADAKSITPKSFMIILNENRSRLKLAASNPPVMILKLDKNAEANVVKEVMVLLEKINDLQKG